MQPLSAVTRVRGHQSERRRGWPDVASKQSAEEWSRCGRPKLPPKYEWRAISEASSEAASRRRSSSVSSAEAGFSRACAKTEGSRTSCCTPRPVPASGSRTSPRRRMHRSRTSHASSNTYRKPGAKPSCLRRASMRRSAESVASSSSPGKRVGLCKYPRRSRERRSGADGGRVLALPWSGRMTWSPSWAASFCQKSRSKRDADAPAHAAAERWTTSSKKASTNTDAEEGKSSSAWRPSAAASSSSLEESTGSGTRMSSSARKPCLSFSSDVSMSGGVSCRRRLPRPHGCKPHGGFA
mmetsp:Transcript_7807/g.25747  ORF Transcript_7807/g.25747 Transcript_7807/m.25747 type:complete len:296 (-) Transcript_7807:9-896(-)